MDPELEALGIEVEYNLNIDVDNNNKAESSGSAIEYNRSGPIIEEVIENDEHFLEKSPVGRLQAMIKKNNEKNSGKAGVSQKSGKEELNENNNDEDISESSLQITREENIKENIRRMKSKNKNSASTAGGRRIPQRRSREVDAGFKDNDFNTPACIMRILGEMRNMSRNNAPQVIYSKYPLFYKRYKRLSEMIVEQNGSLELAKKIISITYDFNKGKLNDKEAAYLGGREFAREFYPKDVLRKEGLL